MITVQEADKIIQKEVRDFGIKEEDFRKALGQVLREDLIADRDFPPFNRVTMDGIALQYSIFEKGILTLKIEGVAAAGSPQLKLENSENCLEVMTGCPLPENTNTVIRYEDLTIENGLATINVEALRKGQNIHRNGEDHQKSDLLVSAGKVISAAEIGVAATIGKSKLAISRMPKTIIISTGDELVNVNESPLPHQIRRSNTHQIAALLSQFGLLAEHHHIKDDYDSIQRDLAKITNEYEVIILSGGVSKGKFDFIPSVLESLGVTQLFHRVQQRPGKPFWFGKASNGTLVFALPGNPVSSFMCARRYFISWLLTSIKAEKRGQEISVILNKDVFFKPNLTYFMQVSLEVDETGRLLANPILSNGSGDFVNLVEADGFLELPQERIEYKKGEVFKCYKFR